MYQNLKINWNVHPHPPTLLFQAKLYSFFIQLKLKIVSSVIYKRCSTCKYSVHARLSERHSWERSSPQNPFPSSCTEVWCPPHQFGRQGRDVQRLLWQSSDRRDSCCHLFSWNPSLSWDPLWSSQCLSSPKWRVWVLCAILIGLIMVLMKLLTSENTYWHASLIITSCDRHHQHDLTSEKTKPTSWASPIIPILIAATEAGPHWNCPRLSSREHSHNCHDWNAKMPKSKFQKYMYTKTSKNPVKKITACPLAGESWWRDLVNICTIVMTVIINDQWHNSEKGGGGDSEDLTVGLLLWSCIDCLQKQIVTTLVLPHVVSKEGERETMSWQCFLALNPFQPASKTKCHHAFIPEHYWCSAT